MKIKVHQAKTLHTLIFLGFYLTLETANGAKTAKDRASAIKRTRIPRKTTTTAAPTTVPTPTIPPQTLRTPQEIKDAMLKSEIIPDLLQKAPAKAVLVKFEGNSTADLGNHLSIRDLEYWAPLIQWQANETEYHTLMMINLDMPTRKNATQREYIVWLIGNIPGCWVMRGDQIIEYEEPEPEKGAGSHRYVVLIYYQKEGKINFPEYTFKLVPKMLPQECRRQKFNARSYAKEFGLGDPIGINFWETQYEEKKTMVPTMNYEYYEEMK